MANLREQSLWEEGVYQIETSDPVMGGENGVSNRPLRQLANRTLWLKTELAKAVSSIGQNKTAADQGLSGKVDKTTQVTAGAGLTGGGALGGSIQIQLGTPGKLNGSTTNWAGSNTHTHEIDKATPTVAGVVKLINNLTAGGTDAALTAEQGKALKQLIDAAAAGAVPYTGATRHADLNGKNLTNVGEVKLGDGRNSDYQQVILGNYGRSPGKGNYGAIFNGKHGGDHTRWMAIGTFSEDGNHISGLWADAAKAYVRIGSTNHELATKGTTLAHYGIADFQVRQMPGNPDTIRTDGHYAYHTTTANLPATGAYHLHVVAGGAASWCRQIAYKAYSSEMWMRWQVSTSDDNWSSWVRIDGADWADVRGRPTTLAGYGITDAASKAEVAALVTGNLAEQGWTKLPNGLILQWGQADGSNRANFPIAFNQCFSAAVMESNTNDTWNYAFAHDNTSIWVSMRGDKIRGFKYIAIGR